MEYKNSFGERLKVLRTASNDKQATIAELLHTTKQTISRWEKRENEPSLDALLALADYFNVTTDYLLGRTDER